LAGFDAGSVVGHFNLDGSGWINGAQNIQKSTDNITGSIFKANLLYDVFKKTLTGVVNVVKSSITEFVAQEKAEAQLNAVLKSTGQAAGLTKVELLDMASAFQDVTTFGDEVVLSAENILLTFTKIGKDIFPLATETVLNMSEALGQDLKSSAIQLGKALQDPVLGVTALRRVGVNFSEAQIKVIKSLVETGKAADAQKLILKELEKEFGGSARAARDTFGGSLKALNNQIGETKETLGLYITTVGKPFVDNILSLVGGLNEFLKSKQGIAEIQGVLVPLAGIFSVIWESAKILFGYFKDTAKKTIDDIKTSFTNLVGKGNEGSTVFLILGKVINFLGQGLAVVGHTISLVVKLVVDLVNVAKNAGDVIGALGAALTDPLNRSKWEEVAKNAGAAWDAIKTTGKDTFEGLAENINMVIGMYKDLVFSGDATAEQLQTAYTKMVAAINASFNNLKVNVIVGNSQMTNDIINNNGEAVEDTGNTVKKMTAMLVAISGAAGAVIKSANVDVSDSVKKTWGDVFADLSRNLNYAIREFGVFSAEGGAAMQAMADHIISLASQILNEFSNVFNQISAIVGMSFDNQNTELDNWYKKEKKAIEDSVMNEEEKKEKLAALEEEYNAKQAEIKKKQFEANKAMAIVNAIISTATGIMGVWATWGWNPIVAGILTAIIVALGATQIALIASQPTPDFAAAKGGSFPPGNIMVGEAGPEILSIGQTSHITPNNELGGFGGIKQENNYYGDINSEVDLDEASIRQANRIKQAIRG
jgi:hypothetical protein